MKKVFSVSFLVCLFVIPVFSQAVRHDIVPNMKSVALVDARPFIVVNRAFNSSLNQIVNKRVLLVTESSEKRAGRYGITRHSNVDRVYTSNPRIGTVKIVPRSIQLEMPENASPYMLIQNP